MSTQNEYIFELIPTRKTTYKLLHKNGSGIHNFPSKWIANNHPHKGEEYIIFSDMWGKQNYSPTYGFSHALYFGKDRPKNERLCTGLRFSPEFPNKAYGAHEDDALLVQFSDNWNKMTIWIFKGKGKISYSLFQEWTTKGYFS